MNQSRNTENAAYPAFPQTVHLRDYMDILKRRKWIVILFFVAVVTLVSVFSFRATPIYQATAEVLIERNANTMVDLGTATSNDPRDQDFYQTEYNLLQSRTLAYQVIERLKLWKEIPNYAPANPSQLSALMPHRQPEKGGSVQSDSPSVSKPLPIAPMLVDWYLANLQVIPIRGSKLVEIRFMGASPDLVARVANAHARVFIERNLEKQHAAAAQSLAWLKTQLEDQKKKVEAAQQAIHDYKVRNNVVSLEDRLSIVNQKLMDINSALTKAKSGELAKRGIYNQLIAFSRADGQDLLSFPEIMQNPVIQNLRSQLVQIRAEQLRMSASYGPKHPKMIEVESAVRQIQGEISNEVRRWKTTLKAEMDRAVALEASIRQELEAQKKLALALNEKAIGYDVLRREAETNQNIYDILLKQSQQVSLTGALEKSNISIVDPAEVPFFPVKPRIFLNILLAIVLGLFMGTGLAFFVEYMDNTVKVPEDVYRRLGLPVLGMLPYNRALKKQNKKNPLLLAWNESSDESSDPKPATAYSLYDLSCRLPAQFRLEDQGLSGKVVLVESATMGEGKTTVLANMALNLYREGHRVVMVDCDMQRPRLHTLFDIRANGGLAKAMTQALTFNLEEGSLHDFTIDDLFFLISVRRRFCQLTVRNNDGQTMAAQFRNGRLIHIQNEDTPPENRLGTMLLNGGHITELQLKDALERNQRTGQPLGYILINSGYLTQEKLRGPLRLQTEEHLQKLFSWKHGTFRVERGIIENGESEKILFGEDFSATIRRLGNVNGNRFLDKVLLSQVKSSPNDTVYVLPAGVTGRGLRNMTNITVLGKFFDVLKRRFDVVLVDTPPVLDAAGAAPLGSLADGVVLVIKAGELSFKILNEAKNALSDSKIVGAIINQTRIKQDYRYYHS